MKRRVIWLAALLLFSGFVQAEPCQNPKYRVGKVIRTEGETARLFVYVSVAPARVNDLDLRRLACQLRKDYSTEPRLLVSVFSSYKSAKSFVPHPHSRTYDRDMTALKAFYTYDSGTGREAIEMFPGGALSGKKVTILLHQAGYDEPSVAE